MPPSRPFRPLPLILVLIASFPVAHAGVAGKPVSFQRDVRPILSDNCFLCYGFDASTRKENLRFDVREGAVAPRPNGSRVTPGSVLAIRVKAESAVSVKELLERIEVAVA